MYETNPVLVRCWRGKNVESLHRGAWVLTDSAGVVHSGASDPEQLTFGRSATKSFQALPLIETGAADAFGLPVESIALAVASHAGEPQHEAGVAKTLELIGLSANNLLCGPEAPFDSGPSSPTHRILNNCSGKHAGFLAVAQHLDTDPALYLEPSGVVQSLVRDAVLDISGADPDVMSQEIDGCSAPTFRFALQSLATGMARMANPQTAGLAPGRALACDRIVAAAATFPELVAGQNKLCTDLIRVTKGRLFAKIGAEAVYCIGVVGSDRGLAIKIDDGSIRSLTPLVVQLLRRLGFLTEDEASLLGPWPDTAIKNWDGLTVGHVELTSAVLG